MAEIDNKLQRGFFKLGQVCKGYDLEISTQKTKTVVFMDKKSEITKLIIDNKTLEQINHFNYPGCDITYDYSRDLNRN